MGWEETAVAALVTGSETAIVFGLARRWVLGSWGLAEGARACRRGSVAI